jgi:hypothetical protein
LGFKVKGKIERKLINSPLFKSSVTFALESRVKYYCENHKCLTGNIQYGFTVAKSTNPEI